MQFETNVGKSGSVKKTSNDIEQTLSELLERVVLETLFDKLKEKCVEGIIAVEPCLSFDLEEQLRYYFERYDYFLEQFQSAQNIVKIFHRLHLQSSNRQQIKQCYLSLGWDEKRIIIDHVIPEVENNKEMLKKLDGLLKISEHFLSFGELELISMIIDRFHTTKEASSEYLATLKRINKQLFSKAADFKPLYQKLQQKESYYINERLASLLIQEFSVSEEMTMAFQKFISNNNDNYRGMQACHSQKTKTSHEFVTKPDDVPEEIDDFNDIVVVPSIEEQAEENYYYNLLMGCNDIEQLKYCFPKCDSSLYYSLPRKVYKRLQLEIEQCEQLLIECQTLEEKQFLDIELSELLEKQVLISRYLELLGITLDCKVKVK